MKLFRWLFYVLFIFATGCRESSEQFGDILDDGGGGVGTASIAITSYSPGASSYVVKNNTTQLFIVSAVGEGTLVYKWTVDGVEVGSNTSSYIMNAAALPVGTKALKVTISDEVGSVSQEWSVKVNGTPVIAASTPTPASVHSRRSVAQDYSVTMTDPNSDTLTYVWKLDGQENILTGTNSTTWTPGTVDVGTHVISVDVYDGPASDAGTWKVTRSWTTYVNHFATACNRLENETQTNKTCMLIGIAGIGDGLNPNSDPSQFYIRPAAIEMLANGNMFIADDINHVVWFWNRYTSPSTTVVGITVPVNQMKVVAGSGLAQTGNTASAKASRLFLNNPHGIHYDGSNLFISDTSANRGLKVDSNGDASVIFTTNCNSPRGVVRVGSTVYFACFSHHAIRAYDVTTFAASTFAGIFNTAGNPADLVESTFTDATRGHLNGPYGLTADASGNIYVGEYNGCRVRMYNTTASPITLYGTYTISANRQRIIGGRAGGPTCVGNNNSGFVDGEAVAITGAADGNLGNVRNLSFTAAGHLLIGQDSDKVAAINFGATTTVLGVSLTGNYITHAYGSGTAGYNGNGSLNTASHFNNPFELEEDPITGDYFVADYSNSRFRKILSADNKTALVAGNGGQRHQTNAGQGTLEAGQEKMNSIRGIAYDSVSGDIIVADTGNHRIRVTSRYGVVNQLVGTGASGTGGEEDEYPTNSTMNGPRAVILTHATASYGGHVIWADSGNHRIRIYNRSTSSATVFGVTVDAGKVATIGGTGASGNLTSGSALQAAFNTPSGVAYDGTSLYVADTNNHCIKKIDSSGNLSALAGTCGTAGNVNGAVGVGRLNAPEGISYYNTTISGVVHTGIMIADRGNGRVRFYRLSGTTSLLFGTSISVGDANTVACGGTFHTEGVIASLAPCNGVYDVTSVGSGFCFVNFGYHNVRCVNSSGNISTAMGSLQGVDDTTSTFFPGVPFTDEDYNSLSPNYASQNGVPAFLLPSPVAAPGLNEAFGVLSHPLPIRAIDSTTFLVGDHYMGFIRKVKLTSTP